MLAYILFLLLNIIFYYSNLSLTYLFIVAFLFSSIRKNVGWDYVAYYNSVSEVISGNYDGQYIRFGSFWKIILRICEVFNSHQLLFIISAFFTLLAVYWFAKKQFENRKQIFLIYIIFPTLYLTSLSSIRSALALTIILLSYDYLIKLKYKKWFLLVCLATWVHSGAIISIFSLFVYKIKLKTKEIIMCILLIVLFLSKVINISKWIIVNYFPQYVIYLGKPREQETKIFLLYWLIGGIFIILKLKMKNEQFNSYVNIYLFGCFLYYLSGFLGEDVYRIGNYYTVVLVYLIPKIKDVFKHKKILDFLIIAVVSSLFLFNIYRMGKDTANVGGVYIPYKTIF